MKKNKYKFHLYFLFWIFFIFNMKYVIIIIKNKFITCKIQVKLEKRVKDYVYSKVKKK